MQLQDDMFSQFFGGKPHRTRALERHAPPPYLHEGVFEKLPVYTACPSPGANNEPKILTRYLFLYGFFSLSSILDSWNRSNLLTTSADS
jgi:hypothetical protein